MIRRRSKINLLKFAQIGPVSTTLILLAFASVLFIWLPLLAEPKNQVFPAPPRKFQSVPIINSDFETWTDNKPANWHFDNPQGILRSTDHAFGTYSVLLSGSQLWSSDVTLKPGKYLLTLKLKATAKSSAVSTYLIGHSPNNSAGLTFANYDFSVDPTWKPFTANFTISPENEKYLYFLLFALGQNSSPVLLDNIALQHLL